MVYLADAGKFGDTNGGQNRLPTLQLTFLFAG